MYDQRRVWSTGYGSSEESNGNLDLLQCDIGQCTTKFWRHDRFVNHCMKVGDFTNRLNESEAVTRKHFPSENELGKRRFALRIRFSELVSHGKMLPVYGLRYGEFQE